MIDGNQHAAQVDAWLRDAPNDIAMDELLGRFELLFGAIWKRANQTGAAQPRSRGGLN